MFVMQQHDEQQGKTAEWMVFLKYIICLSLPCVISPSLYPTLCLSLSKVFLL